MKERWFMVAPLRGVAKPNTVEGLRALSPEDAPQLGALMHAAYQGTVDDEGESLEDACAEASQTLAGKYGPLVQEASAGVFREGALVAAAVFTGWQAIDIPFLAFSLTHPRHQRQGLARRLLQGGMQVLAEEGHRELALFVTAANIGAVRLYQQLGFEQREFPTTG